MNAVARIHKRELRFLRERKCGRTSRLAVEAVAVAGVLTLAARLALVTVAAGSGRIVTIGTLRL